MKTRPPDGTGHSWSRQTPSAASATEEVDLTGRRVDERPRSSLSLHSIDASFHHSQSPSHRIVVLISLHSSCRTPWRPDCIPLSDSRLHPSTQFLSYHWPWQSKNMFRTCVSVSRHSDSQGSKMCCAIFTAVGAPAGFPAAKHRRYIGLPREL